MNYVPYKVHSHFSIQQAFAHVNELVKRAYELKLPAICLTDFNTVSGAVELIKAVKEVNKGGEHKIRGIIGTTLKTNWGEFVLICKNKQGWFDLLKILGKNDFTDLNCLGDQRLDNLICIVTRINENTEEKDSDLTRVILEKLWQSFGENLYVDSQRNWIEDINTNPLLSGNSIYYVNKEDQLYQQIICCSLEKITLKTLKDNIAQYPQYKKFVETNECYLGVEPPDDSSLQLLSLTEDFDIAEKPHIPTYRKSNKNPDDVLADLCREGWKNRGLNSKLAKDEKLKEIYVARIKEELGTFKEAGLANYMLVVHDFTDFTRRNGKFIGLRGSAVGCMVSYLLGISDVDPIQPDPTLPYLHARELLFSRFYSKGRNTAEHVSLPDVDIDLPISFREKLIDYTRKTYGQDCVANIATFMRMDGRGAIKEIFRVLEPVANSFQVANQITSKMVDTAKVQDILEDLKDENSKYNIINYCVDHIPAVKSYYDEYKEVFDIAIKMASTIRSKGKHAAGIVIDNSPLVNSFPVTTDDKTGEPIVAFEMEDAEYVGAVKYDFLGVAAYEKMERIQDMINNNRLMPIVEESGVSYE